MLTKRQAQATVRGFTEEQLLKTALSQRLDTGEAQVIAGAAWDELVTRNLDRVRAWIKLFRHPAAPAVRIDGDDIDEVAQRAWLRATERMLHTFRGTEVGVFRGALRTCTLNTCLDWCRAELTREKRLAGSLDQNMEDREGKVGDTHKYDGATAQISARQDAEAEEIRARDQALTAAIQGLASEGQRIVISETREGFSSREIADRHGWTVDAVDQHRSRGLRKLATDVNLKEAVGDA